MHTKGYFIGWVFVIALCMAIIHNNPVAADTSVSGYISSDTTWTVANSPYVATGNIIVKSGFTLTIEPGVTVKVDSGKAIQIDGALIAKGTSAGKITFTKNSSSNWGYILFSDSSTDAAYDTSENYTSGSILEYCVVEFAGGASVSDNGAVRMNNAHPFINYCTIKNNSASGIFAWNLSGTLRLKNNTLSNNTASNGGGIYSSGGTVIISGNTISNNTASSSGGGIYSYASSSATISGNTISNNTASSSGGGVYSSSSSPVTISGNTISNNTASNGGGIYLSSSSSTGTISGNTISNNTASSDGGGIYANASATYFYNAPSSSVTISGNTISNNTASSGGGICSYASDYYSFSSVTISGNTISNNTSSSSGGGIYANASSVTISGNTISNNTSSSSGGGIYSSYSSSTITKNSLMMNSAKNASAVYYGGGDNFTYNTIIGNKATDSSNTYTVYISSNPTFNYNNIFSNTATYELWNGNAVGSSNLDAKNNWWGTMDDSTIQGKIYDWIDDTTMGLVDYSPFETSLRTDCPISPPTGLTATAGAGQITLSWTANSESDTAGYRVYWDTDSGHSYASFADAGNATSYTITGIADGKYYVTVTAYDATYSSASDDTGTVVNENQTNGNESWYAEEKTVTLGVGGTTPTPTPLTTPAPSPTPTSTTSPAPTLSPSPTPQVSPSPSSKGIVFGIVNDEDELLLEGVTVTIVGVNGSSPVQNSTETDEYGYYEFGGLAKGNYILTYEKDGYDAQTKEISLNEGEVKDIGIVTMEQSGSGKIYGYVIDIRGNPIEFVRLRLKLIKTKAIKTASSDADGFFEFTDLEPGAYIIMAKKNKYRNNQQKVKLEEGESTEIEIEMKKTSKRVIDERQTTEDTEGTDKN